jgi:cyclophilin family peptidyl-prolyl cis-trans isomerase
MTVLLATTLAVVMGATHMNAETKGNPIVIMETSKGTLKIECYPDKAPITVKNFLNYVDKKFYDGLVFHRVKPNFVIQGGGFTKDLVKKSTNPPIENEATNGLKNLKYTLSMARTPVVKSGTSQFFVNLVDNAFLDHRDTTPQGYGYAVFAKVIEGMSVVDAIGKVQTTTKNGMQDVPATPVTITKAYIEEAKDKKDS